MREFWGGYWSDRAVLQEEDSWLQCGKRTGEGKGVRGREQEIQIGDYCSNSVRESKNQGIGSDGGNHQKE